LNELWSVSSNCLDGLEHIDFTVLDNLFDAGIGSAVHARTGLTVTEI
jgi:hypothetical protein